MLNRIRMAFLAFFLLSAAFINVWLYCKLDKRYPDSPVEKAEHFVSCNLMVSEYAFFSPHIPDSYCIGFLVGDDPAREEHAVPFCYYNRELENKIFSVLHKFYTYGDLRDFVAWSLASFYFSQNRQSDKVTFFFSLYKLPAPDRYSRGDQPSYELVYAREYFNK